MRRQRQNCWQWPRNPDKTKNSQVTAFDIELNIHELVAASREVKRGASPKEALKQAAKAKAEADALRAKNKQVIPPRLSAKDLT